MNFNLLIKKYYHKIDYLKEYISICNIGGVIVIASRILDLGLYY